MGKFERAFEDLERAAAAGMKAGGLLAAAAKQLVKAAQEGDLSKIRKAIERLRATNEASRQDVANSISAWSFSDEEAEAYLRDGYEDELLAQAKREGLQIQRNEERLVAFPSLIRLLPKELAVQVNRKKVTSLRPSRLVEILKISQKDKSRFAADRFIESLFSAYKLVVGPKGNGTAASLARIYEALTLLPGSSREYSPADFSRDLFLLDQSGIIQTKSGLRLSLPAATGTKGGQKTFTFVSPDGSLVTYYGISFLEGTP